MANVGTLKVGAEVIFSYLTDGSDNCCKAHTAECLACQAGQAVEMFCRLHPEIEECKGLYKQVLLS